VNWVSVIVSIIIRDFAVNITSAKLVKPALLLLTVSLVGGCATSREAVDKAQSTADQAATSASAAQDTAEKALSSASRAQQTADSAKRTADDAARAAQQSLDASQRNSAAIGELNDKIDRMFKKAMRK
jgi:methyl-accepting chemotaxis protein